MSDAEVMTTAIAAMLYFKGNFCLAGQHLCEHGYIPHMLNRSRFKSPVAQDCRSVPDFVSAFKRALDEPQ